MTSFLARSGHADTWRAVQTIWRNGKRKRPDWICADCIAARRALRQRRGYSDATTTGLYDVPTASWENQRERDDAEARTRRATTREQRGSWGLRTESTEQQGRIGNQQGQIHEEFFNQQFEQNESTTSTSEEKQLDFWQQLESAEGDSHAVATDTGVTEELQLQGGPPGELPVIADDALLAIDYRQQLGPALAKGEADMVIRCLFAATSIDDLEWLRSIPDTTFSEIILLLEPRKYLGDLPKLHQEMSSVMVERLNMAHMRLWAMDCAKLLREVVSIRSHSGRLSLQDWTVLLRGARDLGSGLMSAVFFRNLLVQGHTPNTECYNLFMAATVWNGFHNPGARYAMRITSLNMARRKTRKARSRWGNYGVGPDGVREGALKIFNDMLAHGATADLQSFRILITAAAHEGDMEMVKSILRRVWGLDVEAVLRDDDDASVTLKQFPHDSPLRPTEALLWTLAHAFGVNNDIPSALRIVDLVARHYDLPITEEVWGELFMWTFVLSTPRWGKSTRAGGDLTGQLPVETLRNLWNTMTGAPYHIQPTLPMYNKMITNYARDQETTDIIRCMHEARDLYQEHRVETEHCFRSLLDALELAESGEPQSSLEHIRNKWELQDLAHQRNTVWMKRWVRQLLGTSRYWYRRTDPEQVLIRALPQKLWTWRPFAPNTVEYEIVTGFVHIEFRTEKEILLRRETAESSKARKLSALDQCAQHIGERWIRPKAIKTRPPKPKKRKDGEGAEDDVVV